MTRTDKNSDGLIGYELKLLNRIFRSKSGHTTPQEENAPTQYREKKTTQAKYLRKAARSVSKICGTRNTATYKARPGKASITEW